VSPIGTDGLLSVDEISPSSLLQFFKEIPEVSQSVAHNNFSPRGSALGCLGFFELSTRTRVSFEAAGRLLGIDWIHWSDVHTSVQKGESWKDSFEVLSHYGIDFYVIRHEAVGFPRMVREWTDAPVFNAGDGAAEHPSQSIGDVYCLWKLNSSKEWKIGFYGDILRSRVFASSSRLMKKLGWEVFAIDDGDVNLAGRVTELGVPLIPRESLRDLDVCFVLRTQKERGGVSTLGPLKQGDLRPDMYWMHAGPVIRGQDMEEDLCNYHEPKCLVLDQVKACFETRILLLKNWLRGKQIEK